MILGDCTGLSCYLAAASAKPNSNKSNGSSAIRHGLCCPTGGYSGVLSMSTLKRGKNTVVAGAGDGGFTYRGAPGIGGFGGFFPIGTLFFSSSLVFHSLLLYFDSPLLLSR
jgi:hypothetical protein